MKVSELIAKLKTLSQNSEVQVLSKEENVLNDGYGYDVCDVVELKTGGIIDSNAYIVLDN